jgi:putative NIF3 family GTP cyclohydrolase 1 type 2
MIRTIEGRGKSEGVKFSEQFAQWPRNRDSLVSELQGGEELPEDQTAAEVRAFDAALAEYKNIAKQREDRRNPKLHIGAALVTTDGNVHKAHNNVDEHAEEGVLRELVRSFEKIEKDKPFPRIAALALVGVHADESLHEGDDDFPQELIARNLPKGLPTPCYKCLYKIHRAVKSIAESRAGADGKKPLLNFPILVTSTAGTQILRTDYNTVAGLPWAGTHKAKGIAELVK